MAATKQQVLELYRQVLRASRAFPERSMGAKLHYNTRELIRLRRGEESAAKIQQFLQEGYDTLRMYQALQEEPTLLTAITRKKEQAEAVSAQQQQHAHLHDQQQRQQQQESRAE